MSKKYQTTSSLHKEDAFSVSKTVDFFVQGLDRHNRDVKIFSHPEFLDNNTENFLAKIFNCGNTRAYATAISVVNNTGIKKFFIGVPQTTSKDQSKHLLNIMNGLNNLLITEFTEKDIVEYGKILFVSRNLHFSSLRSVINELENSAVENKNYLLKNFNKKSLLEQKLLQIELDTLNIKVNFWQNVKRAQDTQELNTYLLNAKPSDLGMGFIQYLTISLDGVFPIKKFEDLKKQLLPKNISGDILLVPTTQPHVEISVLNKTLTNLKEDASFIIGLDNDNADSILASCPGCGSYFEAIQKYEEKKIAYIEHTQLPRDFNLNEISEIRQFHFLIKFRDKVAQIYPDVLKTSFIKDEKAFILYLEEILNPKIIENFDILVSEETDKDKFFQTRQSISSKIEDILGNQSQNMFNQLTSNYNQLGKVKEALKFKELILNNIDKEKSLNELIYEYSRTKNKDEKLVQTIQGYIFSKFDDRIKTIETKINLEQLKNIEQEPELKNLAKFEKDADIGDVKNQIITALLESNLTEKEIQDTLVAVYELNQNQKEPESNKHLVYKIANTLFENKTLIESTALEPFFHEIIKECTEKALKGSGEYGEEKPIDYIDPYFGKYTLDAIDHILSLRINDLQLKNIKVLQGIFINQNHNNISDLLAKVSSSKEQKILVPLNLLNKHAVGLIFEKDQVNNVIIVKYIDSLNKEMPRELKKLITDDFDIRINLQQLSVEQQQYANCAPEVIENFMFYLTGKRVSQEKAVELHSKLMENALLNIKSFGVHLLFEELTSNPNSLEQSEDDNNQFHNFDYDNTQLEVAGDAPSFGSVHLTV